MSRAVRSLPAGSRGLDVGCGDGQFVAEANAMGMRASGLELDERVVASARAAGLDVRLADLTDVARDEPGCYDAITMSHLVEHLPDPVAFLRAARRVLRPGGLIWIATPNVGGAGHQQFGRHWRGLEPPGHLVIFGRPSLERALRAAGFGGVERLRATPVSWYGQARSANGRAGRLPTDRVPLRRRDRAAGLVTDLRAQFGSTVSDELLVLARAE
jgi:SAM-dependent methyltransferase